MSKRRTTFKTYGPNTTDKLSLVSLNDKEPFRAHWPISLTQIIGGKTWSLSVVRYQTKAPVLTDPDDYPRFTA